MSSYLVRASGASDTGRQREHNEDRFLCDVEAGVYMVVDGVGGYAAGEVAAGIACDLVSRRLRHKTGTTEERLREAITAANNEIYNRSRAHPQECGMACVLTAAVVADDMVTVGHVGDARLYEVRRDGIRKITRDHSLVGVREDRGELSEQEAMNHPRRSEILRDLGSVFHDPNDQDFIDIYRFAFSPESALLLCTDGLTDLVPQAPIHEALLAHAQAPDKGVEALIDLANKAGGQDNITAVLIEGPAFGRTFSRNGKAEEVPPAAVPGRQRRRRRGGVGVFVGGLVMGVVLSLAPLYGIYRLIAERLPPPPSVPAQHIPQTLLVSQTEASAYPTIGEALAEAQSGDVILVEPGIYQEALHLKEGVAIIGASSEEAVLQLPVQSPDSVAVVAQGIREARLQGLKVEGGGEGGAITVGLLVRDADVTVADVEVVGVLQVGIQIEGVSHPELLANRITDNGGPGVVVRGSGARPSLVQNVIRRNGAAEAGPGLLIEAGAAPVVRHNLIAGNAAAGIHLRESLTDGVEQLQEDNFFRLEDEENVAGAIQVDG